MAMLERWKNIYNKNLPWISKYAPPILIVLLMLPLRLISLGYSEYICDESVALNYLKTNQEFYSWDFLLSQHKGPMQYIIAGLIFIFTGDVFNEVAFRIPFALINVFSILVLYLFLINITKNTLMSLFVSLIFGVNGLIVAFGRIFQYQSLNILFSILSLYFFSNIQKDTTKKDENKIIKNSVLGSLFFCLSILAHWDAIFILPYVLFVVLKDVIFKKDFSARFRWKFVLFNAVVLLALVVFYLYPYLMHFLNSPENQQYFQKRVSPEKVNFEKIIGRINFLLFRFRLYNPILFLEYCFGVILLSLVFLKKSWFYLVWFIFEVLVFVFVFTSPGTHIYNMLIPLSVFSAVGLSGVNSFLNKFKGKFSRFLRYPLFLLLLLITAFFYYQSFVLFVDHRIEYPWRKKFIFKYEVGGFSAIEKRKYLTNNKIGFPLNREWERIGKVMSDYERENGIPVGSLVVETNENECPVNFYTGRNIGFEETRFIVGVKYPLSMANDYKGFSKVKMKTLLEVVRDKYDNTTAVVYVKR